MPLRYEVDPFYPNHSCCFVTIPVDLHLINYPKQYTLAFSVIESFFIGKNQEKAFVVDSTKQVSVPPPQILISTDPTSVQVRAGEEEKV
jgi:hypothetical protein